MAITTITNSMVSVNAIQGTLIADNAITAVHIASNAVASIQIAENNVTAREIAANTITVAQLADDAVEADKIADGVITTNHLNKAMISSQTEVAVATGDFILLGDTSDSNNLKKAPISSILAGTLTTAAQTNITSVGTLTGLTVSGATTLNSTAKAAGTVLSTAAAQVNSTSAGGFGFASNNTAFYSFGADTSTAGSYTFQNLSSNASVNITAMKIAADGKVGIGIDPTGLLHVDGHTSSVASIFEGNGNGDTVPVQLKVKANNGTTSTQGLYGNAGSASTDNTITLGGSGTSGVIVDNGGKVGINTTPDTLLNLKDTGGIEVRLEADSNNNGQEDCFIRFYTDGKTQEGIAGMDNNNSSTLFSGNTENAMVFGTVSNLPVVLATNNTERFQISAAGNVGINNTSPAQKLHVGGGVRFSTTPTDGNETRFNFGIGGAADDPTLVIYRHDGSSESVRFQPGSHIYFENKLLVGTTSTTGMSGNGIESNGSIRANNYILSTDLVGSGYRNLNARPDGIISTSTSLRELKENITDMSLGLSDVLKLKPREFDWKKTPEGKNAPSIEGDTEDIGFIADEVFDVSPKLATYKVGDKTKDNLQGVKYDTMTSLLVKAIQELEARVKELEG